MKSNTLKVTLVVLILWAIAVLLVKPKAPVKKSCVDKRPIPANAAATAVPDSVVCFKELNNQIH